MSEKEFKISTSILSADFAKLGDQIKQVEDGGADWIHIDVMDGHFVPNLTMGPFIVEHCARITSLPLDVHLMVNEPEKMVQDFANAGANILTVHIEATAHIHKLVQTIQQLGAKAGICLNPGTPVEHASQILPFVDLVLMMSVNPGYSGQKFLPFVVDKVAQMREMMNRQNSPAYLEVDGGINPETLPLMRAAGADVFVAATAIFGHPQGIQVGVKALRNAAK